MDKGQAKQKLRDLIARETSNIAPPPVTVTLRWLFENRFLPQKEEQWKVTSRPKTKPSSRITSSNVSAISYSSISINSRCKPI
jgi:hypothetical protein